MKNIKTIKKINQQINQQINKQLTNNQPHLKNIRIKEIKNNTLATEVADEFSFSKTLESMKTSNNKALPIIALYWEFKIGSGDMAPPEDNKQFKSMLGIELRIANSLVPFPLEK